jgi:hypothetical protein
MALLWTLHVAGAIDEPLLVDLLSSGDETLRAQAVKLASEPRKVSDLMARRTHQGHGRGLRRPSCDGGRY